MFTGFTVSNAESAPRDTPVAHQVDPWVAPWLKGTYPRSDQDVNKPYSTRSKKYGESQEKKPTFRMCGEAGLWKILPARYIKLKTGYFVFIDVSTKQSPLLSGINSQLSLYNYCFAFFGRKSYRRELIQILVLLRQMHVVVAPKWVFVSAKFHAV